MPLEILVHRIGLEILPKLLRKQKKLTNIYVTSVNVDKGYNSYLPNIA